MLIDKIDYDKLKTTKQVETEDIITLIYEHVRVIEIHECEYIIITGNSQSGNAIIHKENSEFCAKRNKK